MKHFAGTWKDQPTYVWLDYQEGGGLVVPTKDILKFKLKDLEGVEDKFKTESLEDFVEKYNLQPFVKGEKQHTW